MSAQTTPYYIHTHVCTIMSNDVTFNPTAKPVITLHPQSQQVVYGQEFSLGVAVRSPSHPTTFQWFKNFTQMQGKSGPTVVVKSAVDSDAGEYYCVAANKGGSVDSDIAFVKLLNPHFFGPSRAAEQVPRGHHHHHHHHSSVVGGVTTGIPRNFSSDDLIGRGYLEEPHQSMRQRTGSLRYSSLRRNSGGEFSLRSFNLRTKRDHLVGEK